MKITFSSRKMVSSALAAAWMSSVLMAGTFDWKGGQGNPEVNGWMTAANWCQTGGPPTSSGDDVLLDLGTTVCTGGVTSTCIYDATSPLTIDTLTVTGNSPTKMKLHLRDDTLTLVSALTLDDYSSLKLDDDLFVGAAFGSAAPTNIAGRTWVEVAAGKTFDMNDLKVQSDAAELNLAGSGTVLVESARIDAQTDNAKRQLKLTGGTLWAGVTHEMWVVFSHFTDSSKRAKLWVASDAAIRLRSQESHDCDYNFSLVGGTTEDTRVEADLDGDIDMSGGGTVTALGGYVHVDLDNADFSTGRLAVYGRVTVTNTTPASGSLNSTCNPCMYGCCECVAGCSPYADCDDQNPACVATCSEGECCP